MRKTLWMFAVLAIPLGVAAADDLPETATNPATEVAIGAEASTCTAQPLRLGEMSQQQRQAWADARDLIVRPVGGGAAEECPRINKCGPGCQVTGGCSLVQDTGLTECRLESSIFSCKAGQTVHVRECACGPDTQPCLPFRRDLVCN